MVFLANVIKVGKCPLHHHFHHFHSNFFKYSYKVSIGISTFYFLQPFIFFSIFHIFFVLLFEASRSLAAIFSWIFLKLLFICLLNAFAFKLNSSFVLSDLSNLYLSLSLQNERNLIQYNQIYLINLSLFSSFELGKQLLNKCHIINTFNLDRMVVGFTTTYVISAYHRWCCEFESRSGRGVQHYVTSLSVTWDRSVVFSGSAGFLHL